MTNTLAKQSAWYRDIGDAYARQAESTNYALAKEMNSAEAAKYYGIAARLETFERSLR